MSGFWKPEALIDRTKRVVDLPVVVGIYFLIGVIAPLMKFLDGKENNIKIFFASIGHLISEQDLYAAYPAEYGDYFLYGPIFCLFVAPFAYLPPALGTALFCAAITACFVGSVYFLKLEPREKGLICLICILDYLTNSQNFQTNGLVAAMVIFGLGAIQRDKPWIAGVCIAFGIMMKVYGIIGLSLFFFADRRWQFAMSVLASCVLFFLLPALFSSIGFIIDSYGSWFQRLGAENKTNTGLTQAVGYGSIFDTMRRGFGIAIPVLPVLVAVAIIYGSAVLYRPLQRRKHGAAQIIASALMAIVLFSTGTENPTYIILQAGVAIWFVLHWKSHRRLAWTVLAVVMVFSSLAPTDAFKHPPGTWYNDHAMRALPCFILWCVSVWELWRPQKEPTDLEPAH